MAMRARARSVPSILVCFLLASTAAAGPLPREDVPEPLRPWIDWVLRDAPDAVCPSVHGLDHRQCVWPSRLTLELGDASGRFRQEWHVWREAWVPLPGDAELWPQDTRVDGGPAVVVSRDGVPSVQLGPGRHEVTGELHWSALPEGLPVPAETGLVELVLGGEPVAFPDREPDGRVWLRRPGRETTTAASIDVVVQRRLHDEVPLQLASRIELRVAGESREVVLGPALPAGFVPMAIDSPLPARIEADRRLRVQVRPGAWEITLFARHQDGPVAEITAPEVSGDWDRDEIWVFQAVPALRVVEIEGVPAVDPQQTRLPPEWRSLPAYLVKAGDVMRLVERRRGDAGPATDQLELARTLWLDFDGEGYTVADRMSGQLRRGWRLEARPRLELGRVAIDGQDQLITRRRDSELRGVEVRQGRLSLQADSRIESGGGPLPAVGWNHDLQGLRAQLHLPPGWTLLHARGVDDARSTWVSSWSLLEVFLVLVFALAIGQLFGPLWAGIGVLTFVLTFPESGSPRYVWLLLLATEALRRVAPPGRFLGVVRAFWIAAVVVLALIAIPFAVTQVRQAVYPALEIPWQRVLADDGSGRAAPAEVRLEPAREAMSEADALEERIEGFSAQPRSAGKSAPRPGSLSSYLDLAPDPTARVSTGPGLPSWSWRSVGLHWQGPVDADQQIGLWLLPPWANLILGWLRVLLLGLLVVGVLGQGGRLGGPFRGARPGAAAAGLLALLLVGPGAAGIARAGDPDDARLAELRRRLLEEPECRPLCASSARLALEIEGDVLRARMEIDVAWPSAVPLPGGLQDWTPDRIAVDGAPAQQLARAPDGALYVQLDPGRHQIVMRGALPTRETVELALPLRPHRVEVATRDWTVNGIRDDGRPAGNLQLVRRARADGDAPRTLEPGELPAFLRVERTLRLGLTWQVHTRVVRLTPTGRGLFVAVPLLAGESVNTDAVPVEDGVAAVSLDAQQRQLAWTSSLAQTQKLELAAPRDVAWTEVWTLDASPVWHVETGGIPAIHPPGSAERRVREWRPWPGESVTIDVARPAGVEGQVLTIDESRVSLEPGIRATQGSLDLVLRASRGMQYGLRLPADADLQAVAIDGVSQPLRQVDGEVVLPVAPGKHVATIRWHEARGLAPRFVTSRVDLGQPGVNASTELRLPPERWILLTGGPRLGPAVLFWSILAVIVLLALGLGRLPLTPLRWHGWLLLMLGLTQVPLPLGAIIVGWLLLLGVRERHRPASRNAFAAAQLGLGLWTVAALGSLLFAVHSGLLGHPEMQIAGNGSGPGSLRWYQDRTAASLPTAWVLSLPVWAYRVFMLAWALWLARALLGWLRWGWSCFSSGGLWPERAGT